MQKSKLWFLILLLIVPVLSYAKSSVWLAEQGDKRIILAGSVHLLHPSQLPIPDEYLKAFAEAERIVFEIDLTEMNSMMAAAKMMQTFQLQGTTLDKTLQPEVWQKLKEFMQQHNVPTTLVMFDAAFMSFSLPVVVWQQQGYGDGIDKILYDKAKQEGKTIIGLETFDQQLSALASLKEVDPNVLINETIKGLTDPKLTISALIKQVYQGDTEAIDKQMDTFRTKEMEKFYQSLLVDRNKAWLSQIEGYATDKIPTMVVVGAMHLVGDESVLAMLADKGYKISFYQ